MLRWLQTGGSDRPFLLKKSGPCTSLVDSFPLPVRQDTGLSHFRTLKDGKNPDGHTTQFFGPR